jgi:hypothetical protein
MDRMGAECRGGVTIGVHRLRMRRGRIRRDPPTDFGGGPDYWGLHTGLLRLDGSAKPALAAMAKASRAID